GRVRLLELEDHRDRGAAPHRRALRRWRFVAEREGEVLAPAQLRPDHHLQVGERAVVELRGDGGVVRQCSHAGSGRWSACAVSDPSVLVSAVAMVTRSRPAPFDAYMAASAVRNSRSAFGTGLCAGSHTATPMLAATTYRGGTLSRGRRPAWRNPSAMVEPASSPASSPQMPNPPPPYRATESPARAAERRREATSTSTSSPIR